jgi:hypothetical protein
LRGEERAQLAEQSLAELPGGHEGEEQRDVRGDVERGVVVPKAPFADERLRLGDRDNKSTPRHQAERTLKPPQAPVGAKTVFNTARSPRFVGGTKC